MCIGNTTSPAANNTTNVRYGGWGNPDEWERPEVIDRDTGVGRFKNLAKEAGTKKSSLKTKPKSQSSKTSGGTY